MDHEDEEPSFEWKKSNMGTTKDILYSVWFKENRKRKEKKKRRAKSIEKRVRVRASQLRTPLYRAVFSRIYLMDSIPTTKRIDVLQHRYIRNCTNHELGNKLPLAIRRLDFTIRRTKRYHSIIRRIPLPPSNTHFRQTRQTSDTRFLS